MRENFVFGPSSSIHNFDETLEIYIYIKKKIRKIWPFKLFIDSVIHRQ